jgi:hypothetical protein
MRVQAFDSLRATARRRVPLVERFVGVPPRAVPVEGTRHPLSETIVGPQEAGDLSQHSPRFERADAPDQERACEPEGRREGGAVVQPGMVFDDHGDTQMTSAGNAPLSSRPPAELRLHDVAVVVAVRKRMVVARWGGLCHPSKVKRFR